MIIIPRTGESEESVMSSMQDSVYSFRSVSLYGRRIIITEDDPLTHLPVSGAEAFCVEKGLYSRSFKDDRTVVNAGDVEIGGSGLVIAAGPCAVESDEQMMETAQAVKKGGADMLRGGAFKPRTSPYSFQGLGPRGIDILASAGEETGLPVVTEIMDISDYPSFSGNVDMLQVGARNSQNYSLLRFLGRLQTPVLLKNGLASTVDEWLNSGEYILSGGNGNLVMCYRGNRGYENTTRFTMDTGVIAATRKRTHLPICADPSHPAGNRDLVESLAMSAVAAGADMVEIEVHRDPDNALSDASQQLTTEAFSNLSRRLRRIREISLETQP